MDQEMVIPGIGKGPITDIYIIKILVCYLLQSAPAPLSKEELQEVFDDGQLVSYFFFCNAYDEMLRDGHFTEETVEGRTVCMLQEFGRETAEKLSYSLPLSLKDRVVETAIRLLSRRKLERENQVEITPYQNGFRLHCVMHETDFDLMDFSLYLPDRQQAELLGKRFLQDPVRFYSRLIGMILQCEEE